jgi:hypothetical protein
MSLVRKPFAEFAAELAVQIEADREDEPIAETAQLRIIELMPGDWRLSMVFDHAVEVISDESFPTRGQAVETITDRLVDCVDWDQISTERIQ